MAAVRCHNQRRGTPSSSLPVGISTSIQQDLSTLCVPTLGRQIQGNCLEVGFGSLGIDAGTAYIDESTHSRCTASVSSNHEQRLAMPTSSSTTPFLHHFISNVRVYGKSILMLGREHEPFQQGFNVFRRIVRIISLDQLEHCVCRCTASADFTFHFVDFCCNRLVSSVIRPVALGSRATRAV